MTTRGLALLVDERVRRRKVCQLPCLSQVCCSFSPSFILKLPESLSLLSVGLEFLNPLDLDTFARTASEASVMASMLPSIPYPPSRDGYWSPVTSTLNWCEEVRRIYP